MPGKPAPPAPPPCIMFYIICCIIGLFIIACRFPNGL